MPVPTPVTYDGPNGTHWPNRLPTPFLYDRYTTAHVFKVNCDPISIKNRLAALTAQQVAEGVLILVADGAMVGSGGAETVDPLIRLEGDTAWTKRVTIAPESGYGAVTISNARIDRVHNVCWAGFILTGLVSFTACINGALAWCKQVNNLGLYGEIGLVTSDFEIIEVVKPDYKITGSDVFNVKASGGDVNNIRIAGCYWAPNFIPGGTYTEANKPHTDTMQIGMLQGGVVSDFIIEDTVFFSSNNCCIQTGNMFGWDFQNSVFVSGSQSLLRYPVPAGGLISGADQFASLNGAGGDYNFTDCKVFSPWTVTDADGANPVSSVTNSQFPFGPPAVMVPVTGSWTIGWITLESISLPDTPDDTYLNTIWAPTVFTPAVAAPDLSSVTPQTALNSIKTYCDTVNALGVGTSTITASDLSNPANTYETEIQVQYQNQLNIKADNSIISELIKPRGSFSGGIEDLHENCKILEAVLS